LQGSHNNLTKYKQIIFDYLWWLNGKASYHLPQSQQEFSGSLIPAGPTDMYMALGKMTRKIYVIPSKKWSLLEWVTPLIMFSIV
jgi:hypothetical protein